MKCSLASAHLRPWSSHDQVATSFYVEGALGSRFDGKTVLVTGGASGIGRLQIDCDRFFARNL